MLYTYSLYQLCTIGLLVICLLQIKYSLVVILELNGVSEVQYKDVMIIDNGKYQ